MINIQDLKDKNAKDIVNILLKEGQQPFEIYIPKETKQYFSDSEAIAIDYSTLAYSGQLLFDISDEFEYKEVTPGEHESVLFKIRVNDIDLLASKLLDISYGYVNDHPEDDQFSYLEEASNYLYDVEQGIINKVACPYFVEVSGEFEKEASKENMENESEEQEQEY